MYPNDDETFYVRVGTAAQAGAPIGASVNIAQVARTAAEARAAGQAFAHTGQSFFQPGVTLNERREVVREPERPKSFWDHLGGFVSSAGHGIIRALEWGVEATGNAFEADMRSTADDDDWGDHLATLGRYIFPIARLADPEWRENWERAVDAQASVGQTMWLLTEQKLAERGLITPGTSGGVESRGLDLLDNPERWAERQEYFSEGAAHWTTGIGDALWQIFMDPLFVGGKVASGIKAARRTLDVEDVAALGARNVDETVQLTEKQQRAWDLADELARAFETNEAGTVSAALRTRFLRNSSDGGAIAYMLNRAGFDELGREITDEATRLANRRDVIFAGMGDQGALERLRRRQARLAIELEKMQTGLDDIDVSHILDRVGLSADDAVAEWYAKLNDTDLTVREIEVQKPIIRREIEAIERTRRVGNPLEGLEGAAGRRATAEFAPGELARITSKRDVARVAKTIHNGRFLEPIHFVVGRHLPGTFLVSDDDAMEVFHSAVVRARSVMRKMDADKRTEFARRLAELEDTFAAAGIGAASKATRTEVMRKFDALVDEIIATKYGHKVAEVSAFHNAVRSRRHAELRQIQTRAYKAREAGEPLAINMGDGIYVYVDEPPVLRSQLSDWVSIIDPRRLDRFAAAHWKDGLGGWLAKAKTSGAYELTEAGLAGINRLWKFAALLRPYAYFIRAQVDTQARLLSQIGPLKYAMYAARGSRNLMWNLRRVDKGEVAAFTERFALHMQQDALERRLLSLGVDPRGKGLAKLPSEQVAELEARIAPLRERRQALRFNATHDPKVAEAKLAELDKKIAALSERAVKTRAKLVAQRERLVAGMDAFRTAKQLDREIAALSDEIAAIKGAPHDEIVMLRERFRELEERIANVEVRKTGEMVRRGKTAMARRIGLNAGLDKTGRWRKAKVTDAYWDNDEFARRLSQMDARDSILGLLAGATRGQLDELRRTGNWDLIRGSDEQWEEAYLRAVKHQILRDALGQKVLEGWADEDIVRWFRETSEGHAYLRDMRAAGAGEATVILQRVREHVDVLLPEGSAVRSAAINRRDVTRDDIVATWGKKGVDRPLVPGELLDRNWRSKAIALYEGLERSYFKWVAEIPENMLGRHPFYAARFEQHAKNALARAGVADEATLTLEEVNRIRRYASQMARRDVYRYMFDTSKETNIGHFLRFLMPFYKAWEDTMWKWARIFSEKPQAAAVFWDVVRSPNAGGLVVDQNGNLIDAYGNVRDAEGNVIGKSGPWDGYVLIPLPDVPLPGGGSLHEWAGASSVRIAKNAANVIFQGDPWWLPGPGPLMAIPTNELVVLMFPEAWAGEGEPQSLNQLILQYVLPYGPTSDSMFEQTLPAWVRATRDAIWQDGRRIDQVYAQLYMEQLNLERRGLAEPMEDGERIDLVARRTRNWAILRAIGTQMPFSFTPQSRLAWYKSEYDRYRREDPATAEERFMADYPEFFEMAISLSANETGLTATDESWNAVQRYRADIAKNPEYGWFFAGAENLAGGFNQGVYHAQLRQAVGPGTSTTFRSRRDPLEVAREAMVEQGWREYQQVNQAIQLKLEEWGLRSLSAAGAAELKATRDEFVADLARRNPDWAAAYGDFGSAQAKVGDFLNFAVRALNAHPELANRGDGTALTKYLVIRGAIREALADRFDPGWRERTAPMPTFSINRRGAEDLKQIWDEFTAELIADDLGFEQMWFRVLERDDLTADLYVDVRR